MSFGYGRSTKNSHRSERLREAAFGYAFLAPNFAGFALFVVMPVIASAALSFYSWPLSGHQTFIDTQDDNGSNEWS